MPSAKPSPRPADQSTAEDDDSKSLRSELSISQVFASALAAVSATMAASYMGVIGTVIGAAVVSVVATIGTAVYKHSLDRTKGALKEVTRSTLLETTARAAKSDREPTTATEASVQWRKQTSSAAGGHRAKATAQWPAVEEDETAANPTSLADTAVMAAALDEEPPPAEDTKTESETTEKPTRQPAESRRWQVRAAIAAVVVFVITIGSVTAVELIAGQPLSALLWGKDDKKGTSVGGVVKPRRSTQNQNQNQPQPSGPVQSNPLSPGQTQQPGEPTPSAPLNPSGSPAPEPSPSPTPAPQPSPQPTPSPTPLPSQGVQPTPAVQ